MYFKTYDKLPTNNCLEDDDFLENRLLIQRCKTYEDIIILISRFEFYTNRSVRFVYQ